MKIIVYYFAFIIGMLFQNSCAKAEKTAFSDNGRCTGSTYCSACSNCSRCAHCAAGGTCGICARSTPKNRDFSVPKKNRHSTPHRTSPTKPISPKKVKKSSVRSYY